jgi:hypothetical protein
VSNPEDYADRNCLASVATYFGCTNHPRFARGGSERLTGADMPRYHFHIHLREGGEMVVSDSEGVEIAEVVTFEEWRHIVSTVLREEEWEAELVDQYVLRVVDNSGRTLITLPFRSVLARPDA